MPDLIRDYAGLTTCLSGTTGVSFSAFCPFTFCYVCATFHFVTPDERSEIQGLP